MAKKLSKHTINVVPKFGKSRGIRYLIGSVLVKIGCSIMKTEVELSLE